MGLCRQGDRERRTYIGISPKRERGREEKSKSRDLSNRSLRQMGRQRVENLPRDRYLKDISEDRLGRQRAEILHSDLSKKREEERKRATAEI